MMPPVDVPDIRSKWSILAAIAIPMFLNQRTKAKNSGVKEGIHHIQVGVQSYAVDNNDQYPTTAQGGGAGALRALIGANLDNWPDDPFAPAANTPMDAGTAAGTYIYTGTGAAFQLTGNLDGAPDFVVP